MAIRCKCGQFLTKANRCNRCEIDYEQKGILESLFEWYTGSDGNDYITENNRLKLYEKLEIKPKEETKMSFFQYDEKQAGSGFDPVPKGEYEMIISEAKAVESSSGNPMIKVTLTIRTDVEQEGGKRKVFDNLVQTEKAMFKFHNLAKALGWAPGEGAATLEEFAEKIIFQPVRAKLDIRVQSGYNPSNTVVTYLPAQVPYEGGQGTEGANPFTMTGVAAINVTDDDLPF
jgi:hypothetical protein